MSKRKAKEVRTRIRCGMRILTQAILDGYQRRKDRSVSVRFITQEKTSTEVMAIDELVDTFGVLYFRAAEEMNQDEVDELDNLELDIYDKPKTQSQRLRGVLFKLWESQGKKGEFKSFYKQKTESVIEHFKQQIDE